MVPWKDKDSEKNLSFTVTIEIEVEKEVTLGNVANLLQDALGMVKAENSILVNSIRILAVAEILDDEVEDK